MDEEFQRRLTLAPIEKRISRNATQEGLISALWQTWSDFCRSIIICSLSGGVDSHGAFIASPYHTLTIDEILWLSSRLASRQTPTVIQSITDNRKEQSWGSFSAQHEIFLRMNTSNANHLDQCFGLIQRLKDLHTCRNACAHISRDRIQDIRSAQVRYLSNSFRHPSDMIFWVDPTSKDFLWKSWLDEMETISSLV